jgi:hypothetical protein
VNRATPKFAAVGLVALLETGCFWFHGGHRSTPPPPNVAQRKAPTGTSAPKKSSASRPSPHVHKGAQPALKPVTAELPKSAKDPTPKPVFGQVMSETERTGYEREYETNSAAALKALASMPRGGLTPDQAAAVTRIKSFLQQAAAAKPSDWSLAANLALRALLLARDLAGTVH